jgi:3-hydroxyisobutyrate dehydrogenase-like beta-hydroxyacid dehydrogenase
MAATVAVLGLGEAGTELATELLSLGVVVRGYDPQPTPAIEGLRRCSGEAGAVRGCSVVISVNSATDAEPALAAALADRSAVAAVEVWADVNTAAPTTKQRLADQCAQAGLLFADVALMAPVPGRGLRTPMLVSGTGADVFATFLTEHGRSAEVLPGAPAGVAATRKLLRSIFFKGLAATVMEALRAAETQGLSGWMHEHIGDEFDSANRSLVERLVSGTRQHAARRARELEAVVEMAQAAHTPSFVSEATLAWLRLVDEENGAASGSNDER